MPVIPALRQRQEDQKFEVLSSYIVSQRPPCLKKRGWVGRNFFLILNLRLKMRLLDSAEFKVMKAP